MVAEIAAIAAVERPDWVVTGELDDEGGDSDYDQTDILYID